MTRYSFPKSRDALRRSSVSGFVRRLSERHPELAHVVVEGHTDSVGKAETNRKLSQDRANAVRAYLVKGGVAEARLVAVGFGAEKPIGDNKTAKGRDDNRRVEFNIP
jgi:outer membrane protein OmpA-like peptidoglycan-associated protein